MKAYSFSAEDWRNRHVSPTQAELLRNLWAVFVSHGWSGWYWHGGVMNYPDQDHIVS
jgi:hypothetical protein